MSRSVDNIIDDITRLHGSLPSRPDLDDVEAAVTLLRAVDKEEKSQIETITKQQSEQRQQSPELAVPEELFEVQEEMQKNLVHFRSREQKREALELLDLESTHALFDELVQRAEKCLASPGDYNGAAAAAGKEEEVRRRRKFGKAAAAAAVKPLPSGN